MREIPDMRTGPRRIIRWFCLFFLLLECGVVLAPLLQTGYFSDDLINSLENARARYMGWNAFQYYLHRIHSIIFEARRLDPFMGSVIIPYLVPSLAVYKWLGIACVTGNIVLFACYLNSMLKSRCFGYFVAGIIPLLLQFRLYHDPVLSFHLSQQLLAFWMLLTLLFLDRYLITRRRPYLLVSLIAFNLLLYSYEVAYLFPAVIMAEIWLARGDAPVRWKLLRLLPYVLSCLIGIGLLVFVRAAVSPPAQAGYEGIQFNFDPLLICKTFAFQVFAAFPLSYHFGAQSLIFRHNITAWAAGIAPADLLALGALGFLYLAGTGRTDLPFKRIVVLGGLLVIFPAVLIAVSKKYQCEIPVQGLGVGYFVVYLQYYGTALLLGAGVVLVNRIPAHCLRLLSQAAVFAALGAAFLLVLQDNRFVVAKANAALTYRRLYLEQALRDGLLDPAPPDAAVLMKDDYDYNPYGFVTDYDGWAHGYAWRNEYFVFQWTGKKIRAFQKIRPFLEASGGSKYLLLMSNSPSLQQPWGAYVKLYSVNQARERDNTAALDLIGQVQWDSVTGRTEKMAGQATLVIEPLREK